MGEGTGLFQKLEKFENFRQFFHKLSKLKGENSILFPKDRVIKKALLASKRGYGV